MAADPESLDVELAAAVCRELGEVMEEESRLRQAVQDMVRHPIQSACLSLKNLLNKGHLKRSLIPIPNTALLMALWAGS